jgi:hypothetical protein
VVEPNDHQRGSRGRGHGHRARTSSTLDMASTAALGVAGAQAPPQIEEEIR